MTSDVGRRRVVHPDRRRFGYRARSMETLPVIDLRASDSDVAAAIGRACRSHGFFYVVGHGIEPALSARLEALSHRFFALPDEVKARFAMSTGGRAWRGWFPLGGELTSQRPDWKEGLYIGTDLPDEHPRVAAGVPLHGRNVLPTEELLPGFASTIEAFMAAVVRLGQHILCRLAESLALPPTYFAERYTADPLVLFRIFLYPSRPVPEGVGAIDGVGEHTDYGLLTLLRQDDVGGLQVREENGWIDAPPVEDSFVCNIGDMLDRMTGGLYRSTPHRVRLNSSGRDRISLPLFLDPDFDSVIAPIRSPAIDEIAHDVRRRWDSTSVHTFEGTYGDYVMAKVSKVFPQLAASTAQEARSSTF
jgi:isopenicillin N synthase-like dioxygenase